MSCDRKTFRVTVKVVHEYSATIPIRARNQAEAEKAALDKYWRFACDVGVNAVSLGLPPPWDEHESIPHDPEIDTKFHCVDCGTCTMSSGEYYMVSDDLWRKAGMGPHEGMLCLLCLDHRIGRQLMPDDFTAIVPSREGWVRYIEQRSCG